MERGGRERWKELPVYREEGEGEGEGEGGRGEKVWIEKTGKFDWRILEKWIMRLFERRRGRKGGRCRSTV